MRLAHVSSDAQAIGCKITPSLEVVANSRALRQFVVFKFIGPHRFADFQIVQQSRNTFATFAAFIAAMLEGTGKEYCCAQVIPRDSIGHLTLGTISNGRNAKDMILARYGCYREFEKVEIRPTDITVYVTNEQKTQPAFMKQSRAS
jgi:hypothetical protein